MLRVQKILNGIAESGRVAAAYLFCGPPGCGKKEMAHFLADALKCKKQNRIVLAPEGASLKIGQVRELQKIVKHGPLSGQYLCVIIEKADALTDEAAAAFLKTLEEPRPGVVFVLLAEREDKIPATVISRCQRVLFGEKSREWLPSAEYAGFYDELSRIRGGSVLAALAASARLEKEKEKIEELLYELLFYAYHKIKDVYAARVILSTVRQIKQNANLRLALDLMCLKLAGGVNAG